MWKCPYLVLWACVPVEELEESQWVSVPHQDEVTCSIRQVSRRREAQRTFGTWAGHTSERHTPEPALHAHPLAWTETERHHAMLKNITDETLRTILLFLHVLAHQALYCSPLSTMFFLPLISKIYFIGNHWFELSLLCLFSVTKVFSSPLQLSICCK